MLGTVIRNTETWTIFSQRELAVDRELRQNRGRTKTFWKALFKKKGYRPFLMSTKYTFEMPQILKFILRQKLQRSANRFSNPNLIQHYKEWAPQCLMEFTKTLKCLKTRDSHVKLLQVSKLFIFYSAPDFFWLSVSERLKFSFIQICIWWLFYLVRLGVYYSLTM